MVDNVCISFYLRRATIHLHQSALKGINNPLFVGFLISCDKKTLVMRSRVKKDFFSIRIRKPEVYSCGLCECLAMINSWDLNSSYRVYGKAYPEQSIAIFDLSGSKIINKSENVM